MKLAAMSPRLAKLETWWLYLDHGSFFSGWRRTRAGGTGSLTGQVEDGQGRASSIWYHNYTEGFFFFPPYPTHFIWFCF